MTTIEAATNQSIQQAVIEQLVLLSLDRQKEVLAFAEELVKQEAPASKFRAMFEEAAKDVPPEAWQEIPADASANIDRHLNDAIHR